MTLQWTEVEGGQRLFADTANNGTYWVYWDTENWMLEKVTKCRDGSKWHCLDWYNNKSDAKRKAQCIAFVDDA